jgi:transcriptional regulator with XRE-family HTH domain
MAEATTLGTWLRRERERRGVSLTSIADQTKLSISLLKGLEADDVSRWPGGIFRRAFARSYATAIGVDPDMVVRRLEEEHPSQDGSAPLANPLPAPSGTASPSTGAAQKPVAAPPTSSRVLGVAAVLDLLVAGAIGMGFAAGGSRLLWPVLAIAVYHAAGLILTGRSPMLALLLDQGRADAAPANTAEAVAENLASRADRAPVATTRTATARLRQPGRRSRGSRGRAAS